MVVRVVSSVESLWKWTWLNFEVELEKKESGETGGWVGGEGVTRIVRELAVVEVVWSMVVVAEAGTVAVGMVVEGKMSARQRQGVKQWQEKTKVELAVVRVVSSV